MTITESVIDIEAEVIKFAHEQGHTKAHKDVISWNRLQTKSGKPKFTTLSKNKSSIAYAGKEKGAYSALAEHLTVRKLRSSACEPASAVSSSEQKGKASCDSEECEDIYIHENFLLNKNEDKQLCKVTFKPTCKNTADAFIHFTTTLLCSKEDVPETKEKPQLKEKYIAKSPDKKSSSLRRKSVQSDLYPLCKVSLSPKFSTNLSLKTVNPKKISLPKKDRHEVVTNVPSGRKVPVEITQYIEEEQGVFEVDYYLWGFAQVTVWGKPYKLLVADVLDTKNNAKFSRETVCLDSSVNETIQAVKITLHGKYETTTIINQINLRLPKCILRRLSYSLESLKCTCDTCQLPVTMEEEGVLPLTGKNLAKIVFRWKQILCSFRRKHENLNDQLWKALLENSTKLAKVAASMEVDHLCKDSTPIDKFVLTILLWKKKCESLEELASGVNKSSNLNVLTIQLAEELYEIGIPVPVFSFLWSKQKWDKTSEKLYTCPIHNFVNEPMVELDVLKGPNTSKMLTSLPDRVLLRLLQRWPKEDGWLPMALHLEVDLSNIKSLACNNSVFKTIDEKRLTVFKLWRMHHRRSSAGNSQSRKMQTITVKPSNCSTWDLCINLHESGMPVSVYKFLWLDAETTP